VAKVLVCSHGLFLYLLLCGGAVLTGLGILRVLRLECRGSVRIVLAPVAALVCWTLTLGWTCAWRIPVKYVTPWLWLASGLLALVGLCRPGLENRRNLLVLLLCLSLPLLTMGKHFRHGLGDYQGSIIPDGWAYVASAQYLWEHPRGLTGGLPPLHQFGSSLSDVRTTSFALLGFLSPLVRAGDTQAVSALYQTWALFLIACAVALFCLATNQPPWRVVAVTTLATVSGWIANLIWANNLDNTVALVYMPALAALVGLLDARLFRWWLLLGAMLAAALYTYPELAPVIVVGATLAALPRVVQAPGGRWTWLRGGVLIVMVAVLLLLPALKTLIWFGWLQFQASQPSANRPGEGFFHGLILVHFQPAAFWGLGGEHQVATHHGLRKGFAVLLSAVAVFGSVRLLHRRHYGLVLATLLLTGGTLYLIVVKGYSYGAYKLILLNWWCLVLALVAGTEWLLALVPWLWGRRAAAVLALVLGVVLVGTSNHTETPTVNQYTTSANQHRPMANFRILTALGKTLGHTPVLLDVREPLANQWAVYFLREASVRVCSYRGYPGQPHLAGLMQAAAAPAITDIHYLISDQHPPESGWEQLWSGGPFRLYRCLNPAWAVVGSIQNANGLEHFRGVELFWMGQGETRVDVLADYTGTLELEAEFYPGPPLAAPAARRIEVVCGPDYRRHLLVGSGVGTIPVPVKAGSNEIVLRPLDTPDCPPPLVDNPRPLVLLVGRLRAGRTFPDQDVREVGPTGVCSPLEGADSGLSGAVKDRNTGGSD
jgi:hypothetical protein